MQSIQAMNDIYDAICALKQARNIVNERSVHGIGSPLFDTVQSWDITIKRAEEAYQQLSSNEPMMQRLWAWLRRLHRSTCEKCGATDFDHTCSWVCIDRCRRCGWTQPG